MDKEIVKNRAGELAPKFFEQTETPLTLGEAASVAVIIATLESAGFSDEEIARGDINLSRMWTGPQEEQYLDEARLIGEIIQTDSYKTLVGKKVLKIS
jgi:hypothetical protein